MSVKLSIVIPTKNRQKYCIAAVEHAISSLSGVQIVIQDNSDDNSLEDFATSCNTPDVVYNYHGGVLSFVDNFSEALSLATGEYICVIGDDDCVLPNILDAVEYARENDCDALIPGLNAVYCWPSDTPFIKNAEKGYLCLSYLKKEYKTADVPNALKKLMRSGGQEYQKLDLPRIYHGIVRRSAIERVYQTTGRYFGGLTPDIYMAVALACVCGKVCRTGFPITVSGMCPSSGSSDAATGRHTGELKDAPHFRGHTDYHWDPKAPAIYSVESIWAETVLQALHNFGREDLYDLFSVETLDSICLKRYPQFAQHILEHAGTFGISRSRLVSSYYRRRLGPMTRKVIKRLTRRPGDVIKCYDVSDIAKASEITMEQLQRI